MFKRLKLNDMKKIFSLLSILCIALYANAETVFEFTSAADLNQTKDGISVVLEQGSGQLPPVYKNEYYLEEYHPETRLYVGNTITITSSSALKNIQMVFALAASGKAYAGLEVDNGTLKDGGVSTDKTDWKVDSWTGNATKVVFTLSSGKQRQIQKIVIDGAPVVIDEPEEPKMPTEEDLKTDFTYPEPTIVHVPDTVITKKEYAFIDNNILVHCTQGSIIKATDTTFAYFNCNANYEITFTATENIKGIAIDGFVRKAFNATCDHGSITYLTNPDSDEEGSPALVIQNVNVKSVTLSCPKQLRCYELRVYFKENPEAIDMGGEEPEEPENQAIDNVQNNDVPSTKVLRDGQLIILCGDKEYNSLGTQL